MQYNFQKIENLFAVLHVHSCTENTIKEMVKFVVIIYEFFSGWQAAQCQLFVDPLSRGHRAFVYTHEEPFLEYNGQRMDYAEGLYDQCVRDLAFYDDES